MQICILPSWCHCRLLSLALLKSRLVLVLAYPGSPGQSPEGYKKYVCVWLMSLVEFSFWPTVLSVEPLVQCLVCLSSVRRPSSVVCNVLYCGKTVRPSEKVSEGVNRKPGSKSSFLESPPYFYFRFCRYGHRNGRFCLIFARTAQQSVLDGTNGLSSSNPCAYGRILQS